MNIIKKLVVLLLIIFPLGEVLRFDIGNHVVVKPVDFLAGLIALIWLYLNINKFWSKIGNNWYFFAFPIIALISLLFNIYWLTPQEFMVSAAYLIRWVSYFILLFAVSETDQKFKKTVNIMMIIDGAIIVFLGYLQYFFFNSLKPLWYLGWDEHLNRMFTVFFDPNYAGSFFVLYLIYLAGILFARINKKDYRKMLADRAVILYIILIIVTLVALSLTFSRSALLMFMTSAFVFFVMVNMKKFVAAAFGLLVVYVIIISPKFYDENMNLFRVASSMARVANYEKALVIIKDHPVIGIGFNAYRYTNDLYGFDYGWVKAPSHSDAGVENSFLFLAATTGGIGLMSYLLLWYKLVFRSNFESRKKANYKNAVIYASTASLFVNALFINSLFYAPIMLWVWILIGSRYEEG